MITPEMIVKNSSTEHSHQVAFFVWCQQQDTDPRINMTFSVPNGGERHAAVASKMKAEGARKGVPDVFVPIPVLGKHHGLWIEFKKPGIENHKDGGLKPEQVKYRDYLVSQNYAHVVVYSYLQAIDATLEYLAC